LKRKEREIEREKMVSTRAQKKKKKKKERRKNWPFRGRKGGRKKRKENRPVGRSVGRRRRLRGVDGAFENTERTHLNLHPFCIYGYYILKFLCENSRVVVVERVFPAARAKKE